MKTQMSRFIARASMLTTLVCAASAFAQSSEVTVTAGSPALPNVTFLGSGCPAASGADVHWEGASLVVSFGEMTAEKGQGVSLVLSRKNCAITLDLKTPKGLSYALAAYSATGYDDLADKDTRNVTLSNFFQGDGDTGTSSSEAVGPVADDFKVKHFNTLSTLLWSPCNVQRAQTFNAAIRIANGGDRAASSTTTLDNLRLYFIIKPCSTVLR
ncbi:MAG: DUF4360 domain-containing protein [Oligoflexus sp.]|nr:DUF4360 domain-containing protein [Oligoflexus sp.]